MPPKRRNPNAGKLRKFTKAFRKHFREVASEELEEFAWECWGVLTNGIVAQKFPSFHRYPLTEEWLRKKNRLGLDDRVMIATGAYLDSITVKQLDTLNFEVGIDDDEVRRQDGRLAGITLETLATIHEYGSQKSNIPARPHWRVIFRYAQKRAPFVAEDIARRTAEKVNKDLRR